MHLTGYPDRPPVRVGVTISDYLTGVFAAQAATAALYERDAKGTARGAVIDAALYGATLRILEWTLPAYDRLGVVRVAGGQPTGQLGPARQLPHRGRQVRLHRGRQRRQLRPPLPGDGAPRPARRPALRHAAQAGRPERRDQRHRGRVDDDADRRRGGRALRGRRRPRGHRLHRGRHLRRPPRRRPGRPGHRRRPRRRPDPPTGPLPPPRRRGPGPTVGAPTLGQHTTEVLTELGLDDAELARLTESGVI